MENSIKILSSVVLLIISINVKAIDLRECNNCSFSEMRFLAKHLISRGYVAFYDRTNNQANKFYVFTSREPGNYAKDAFPSSFTTSEMNFINALFGYYDAGGRANKSQAFNINVSNVTLFQNTNAYDIYLSGQKRNNLSYWLNRNFSNLLSGGEITNNSPEVSAIFEHASRLFLEYGSTAFGLDLSLDLVIEFADGSQVIFEVDFNDGGFPKHLKDDPRNMDAEGNAIIYSNNANSVGVYGYSRNSTYLDIIKATSFFGIPIIMPEGTPPPSGSFECKLNVNVLECTLRH